MPDERSSAYESERSRMVEYQIAARGVSDPRVLEAMRTVPRHCFVPPEYEYLAYTDGPLPIGSDQTISQPYIVALMSELMQLKGGEKVLEVGTGSGYQAAVLAHLAGEVFTIERHAQLAEIAHHTLESLGFKNVYVCVGDGTRGLPEEAPFSAIMVTAAAPRVPQTLLEQLEDGGRLVLPVGGKSGQYLECWVKHGIQYNHNGIIPVTFVPLIGEFGWDQ